MKSRILPIAALVAVAALGLASMQAVSIKWNPKEGANYKYNMSANMNVTGMDVKLTAKINRTIKSVMDEHVTVEEAQSDTKVDAGGQVMDQPSATETSKVNRQGVVLESKSSQEAPEGMNMKRLGQSFLFIYPGSDVKDGETWVHKVKADTKAGIYSSETTFKYVGIEEVNGVKCWKISSDFKETDAPSAMTAKNTFWVSVDDTEVYKATNSVKNATISDQIPPFDMDANTMREK